MAKVHIVKVKSSTNYTHHAVEQENTRKVLHECDTQGAAIDWAKNNGYEIIDIHRERNRKDSDKHGQFRQQ